jgi:hypothetical protein
LDKFQLSGFIFEDAATLPDRMELALAKHVVFNQIHLTRYWLNYVWSGGTQVCTADPAIVSQKLSSGILSPISCVRLVTGRSLVKGNGPGLRIGVIEGL